MMLKPVVRLGVWYSVSSSHKMPKTVIILNSQYAKSPSVSNPYSGVFGDGDRELISPKPLIKNIEWRHIPGQSGGVNDTIS